MAKLVFKNRCPEHVKNWVEEIDRRISKKDSSFKVIITSHQNSDDDELEFTMKKAIMLLNFKTSENFELDTKKAANILLSEKIKLITQ